MKLILLSWCWGADPLQLEHVRNLLETILEVLTTLHKILDVVDVGEIDPERLEELLFRLG